MLRCTGLSKAYGRRQVVRNVSLEVRPGQVVGLLGPNGAGKTTTFYMTVGFIRPDAGEIHLGEQCLTHLPMYRRGRAGLAYLPQEASVFRKLTVAQNLLAILETLPLTRAERTKRMEQLLEELNLTRVRENLGYQLSGGERRRVEIARALVTTPQFLLLDEPFAGVDPLAVEDIQDIIARLKARNIGILITDHNVRETLAITDTASIIFQGEILLAGAARELIDDPKAREVYLGERFSMTLPAEAAN